MMLLAMTLFIYIFSYIGKNLVVKHDSPGQLVHVGARFSMGLPLSHRDLVVRRLTTSGLSYLTYLCETSTNLC